MVNKYEMHVGNAVIPCKGLNEWSAMEALCLFKIGDMIDHVRTDGVSESMNSAWLYQVEVNGRMHVAYIKRVG